MMERNHSVSEASAGQRNNYIEMPSDNKLNGGGSSAMMLDDDYQTSPKHKPHISDLSIVSNSKQNAMHNSEVSGML